MQRAPRAFENDIIRLTTGVRADIDHSVYTDCHHHFVRRRPDGSSRGAHIGAGVPFTHREVAGTNGRFNWQPEFGLSAGLRVPVNGRLELAADFSLHTFDNELTSYDNADRDIYLLGLQARYQFSMTGRG